MAKYKRYSDSFVSRTGITWRVEIWQEAEEPFTVSGFDCEADQSLLIEWHNTAKEDPMCGSTATLRLESPGDRTYIDLYTINPGDIRLDVYRDNQLFWSGLLDPEFYEEPYERAANYPVSLTFSDFGILDRLKYNLDGIKSIGDVLADAVDRAGLNIAGVDTTLISTSIDEAETPFTLDDIAVDSANWFDEDGEASTLKEVLEAMLQPLGLRMIQRAGKVWVYDLNGLHDGAARKQIEWSGDSSTLSVDKVLNNVIITFSPYGDSTLADNEMEVDAVTPGVFDWKTINVFNQQSELAGFRIGWADTADCNLTLYNGARFFRIAPIWTKEESAGVLWGFRSHPDNDWSTWQTYFNAPESLWPFVTNMTVIVPDKSAINTRPIFGFTTPMINITDSGFDFSGTENRNLLLSLEMLVDLRYNPFEEANENNCKDDVDSAKEEISVMWIPVRILLHNAAGEITHHYVNTTWFYTQGHENYVEGSGYWEQGPGVWGDALLSFYSDDLKNELAIEGWKKNRRFIGRGKKDLPNVLNWRRTPDGEYLPMPPQSGYIEVQIGSGFYTHSYKGGQSLWSGVLNKIKWIAYKNPSIQYTDAMGEKVESEDIEYSGYINKAAKEPLELSTMCGSYRSGMISAKGVYLSTLSGKPVESFKRAGRSGVAEKLFIGTLYSQYANRHTTLSGEVEIDPTGLNAYTEVNQDDRVFIMSGESMDVLTDTTEATFIELSPDSYNAIEEVN